jgi:nitroimidazol reductase NimA-like FMN-containing flavoprotein (pyridoxamine 5'-phosphate oxidase superfamily)
MSVMTYLVDIAPDACADLLASSTLGRLGVIVDGRPEIFPVNHVYDRETGCVAFPTNVRTKLRAALDWPWVAFEVDGLEHDGGAGWSVLVVGRAETITDPDAVTRLAQDRHALWATGEAVTWVRIVPTKVTGRQICASESGITIQLRRGSLDLSDEGPTQRTPSSSSGQSARTGNNSTGVLERPSTSRTTAACPGELSRDQLNTTRSAPRSSHSSSTRPPTEPERSSMLP